MRIIYMLFHQYFKRWTSFCIPAIVNAFVFSFILEPLLVWLHIYEPYHWKCTYSFIAYFVIAIVLKWLMNKFKQMDHHYQ